MSLLPSLSFKQCITSRYFILALYGLLTGIGLMYHEPWRDESHSWLIAHLSDSLPELVHNTRYEGHPLLWYLIAYMTKQAINPFGGLQVVHWLLTLGSAYLLLTFAPFAFRIRVLLLFSYFFLYEYALVSRNYAIGIFCLFLIGTLFNQRHRAGGYVLLCGLFFILFQTNVYALLIGLVVYGLLLIDLLYTAWPFLKKHWLAYMFGTCLVGIGLLLALFTILPPPDINLPPGSHGGWHHWEITICLEMIWNAFVPLPAHLPTFRNTNILETITFIKLRTVLRLGLSGLVVGLGALPLFRSRLALLGWATVCLGMLYIMITQYLGSLRHHGHFALSLLVFLWIQPQFADFRTSQLAVSFPGLAQSASDWLKTVSKRVVTVLLVCQVLAGIICYTTDLVYPFSASQRVAAYLQSSPVKNWFLAGYPSDIGESIAVYLPQNRMYYPSNGQHGGFLRYDKSVRQLTLPQVVDSLRSKVTDTPALLILNYSIEPAKARSLRLALVKRFTGSIQYDEDYYLYRYN